MRRMAYQSKLSEHDLETCTKLCRRRQGLGLRLVNRQINDETDRLFWKLNTLCYHDIKTLLRDIAPRQVGTTIPSGRMPRSVRPKIRRLSLVEEYSHWNIGHFDDGDKIIKALRRLPHLVEVELPATIWGYSLPALAESPLCDQCIYTAGVLRPI